MNYDLKELLGKQDPKLWHAQHTSSWDMVQQMRDTGRVESDANRVLTCKLAYKVLETIPITQTNTDEGLRFRVKVFFHSETELEALLEKAYNLGFSRQPKFMGPRDFYDQT